MQSRPPASAYAAAVAMPFAFGMSFVATKYALRGFEPLLVALLRFTLAGAILWMLLRLRREREPVTRRDLGRLALMGFVSLTIYFSFENTGIARTSASQAAILIATIPIFVAVLNVFTLREPMAARQWAGVVLSFAGLVALVTFGGQSSGGSVGGDLLVLAASLAAAVYSIMARSLLLERSALSVTAYQNLFGAAFMLPLALVEAALVGVRRPTADAVGGVLFLTVMCSVIAYLLLNYAFRFIEASRLSVFINLTPIVGVGFAFLVLGERFTGAQAAAAVVVVLGVWLTNTGSRAAARSPSAG
ncbi:MAG TPA: DMT family transporter [Thermoleophilia bacterium]|nr:DMT family transporter [Thermoleophilia bacterium]